MSWLVTVGVGIVRALVDVVQVVAPVSIAVQVGRIAAR
jgi:hypothetical protein